MTDPFKQWADLFAQNMRAFPTFAAPADASRATGADDPASLQEQFSDLQATWKESLEKWTQFAKDESSRTNWSSDAFKAMFSPQQWGANGHDAVAGGLDRLLQAPQFSTPAFDRRILELQDLAAKRDANIAQFRAIVQRGWNHAYEKFSAAMGDARNRPNTWRELTDRWLSVANEALIEVYRSDEFIQAQARMLRSASDYRLQERSIAESWCEAWHLPTRSEVDELHRTVTVLRRELRLLKRERAVSGAASAETPAPRRQARKKVSASRAPKR